MGVDTKGILNGRYNAQDVAHMLGRLGIEPSGTRGSGRQDFGDGADAFWTLSEYVTFPELPEFDRGNGHRTMHVFSSSNNHDTRGVTDNTEVTVVSLGHSGCSQQVIRAVVEQTGGWFQSNNASGEWVPVPRSHGVTEDELLQNRVRVLCEAMQAEAARRADQIGVPPAALDGIAAEVTAILERRLQEIQPEAALAPGR